ncbi:hypothetical protein IBB3154_1011 [Ligilactobacillus salivarius]|uniref:hypothetical protein n=1 Tax=Ligilactobacillus salivarius TaxID=1624 RepID=UPI0013DE2D04|nr:hypothetical protein [Ligilactobacillus salivarius]MDM8284570.1 hypothetical protein [Ligilactobacillus salivarius]QIG36500.1 hypothetical protein IBB3154_1011 [Ligilactobacillus salivarius]
MLKVDKPVNDSGVIIPDEIFDFILTVMWTSQIERNPISIGHKIMVLMYEDDQINKWIDTLKPIELSLLHDWIILHAKDRQFRLYGAYLQGESHLLFELDLMKPKEKKLDFYQRKLIRRNKNEDYR